MTFILRVEAGFTGPYWNGHAYAGREGRTPVPPNDRCVRCNGGTMYDEAIRRDFDARRARFGFESVDQLRSWFEDDELVDLHGYGYELSLIYVPDEGDVLAGEHQVAFIDAPLKDRIWRAPLDRVREVRRWGT